MKDLNVVAMVGRLTRDSELRMAQSGNGVLRFSIAVNRRKRTADGNWEDEANFFDCAMFGKSAQSMANYLKKGRQVAVFGELQQEKWTGKDGVARSRVVVAASSIQLFGAKDQDQVEAQDPGTAAIASQVDGHVENVSYRAPASRQGAQASPAPQAGFVDDDIPF